MKIENERYYTLKELGGFLFSESTWWRRIRGGEITHLKTGVLLVKGEWIIEYIERVKINANSEKTV